MPLPHSFLKATRLVHLYLGVFTAPALLFFAFTGFVQTFSLHETTRGSSYKPPAILAELGQMHKKQTFVMPAKRPQPPTADKPATAPATKAADSPAPKPKSLLPMKIFFGLVAVGLFVSTLTGLYMSYRYTRNTRLVTAALAAGVVLPVLLALI
jgi:hypothetical protein